jgi:CRP-like cAMP-binding protein
MSRRDIADYLGLTIETVSRTLTMLRRDGTIRMFKRSRIEIRDRAALEALASEPRH